MTKKLQLLYKSGVISSCILFLVAAYAGDLVAQHQVSGTVTDAQTGDPLPGVSIVVQGTSSGVATNPDGEYTLNLAEDGILVFSYIGYERQEIAVEGRSQIDVEMQTMAIMGSDIVVVGYGTQRREDLTSSVSTVRSDEFVQGSARSAAELIQGVTPGLIVTTSSGNPR